MPCVLCALAALPASGGSGKGRGRTVTQALAELALHTKSSDITPAAYKAAKRAVIDALGCALAGYNSPGVGPIVEQMKAWGGKGEAHAWVYGGTLPAPAATFANSTMVHALDLDDVHLPSTTHITSVIVPTAIAMGEATGASGKETLAAVVMGIEVACRLGVERKKRRAHGGFLPTSIMGGFGAAAATCRLKGLSVEQTTDAMGIFYAHCSGNRQALFDRTLTKRIQPAIAARAGVFAGYLAERGITGPEHVAGGPAGLFRIYGSRGKSPSAADVSGTRAFFEIQRLSFKKYASCGASHPLLEATIALVKEHDLKLDDVAEVEIFGVGVNSGMTGVPWRDSRNPHALAQFCAPYEVAAAIKNRRMGPAEITNERIREDKQVDALARRVRLKNPNQFGGDYPGGQTIRLKTTDGRTLVASRDRDDALHPDLFSDDDVAAKFTYNVNFSGLCSPQQTKALLEALNALDKADSIAEFVRKHLVFETKGR